MYAAVTSRNQSKLDEVTGAVWKTYLKSVKTQNQTN